MLSFKRQKRGRSICAVVCAFLVVFLRINLDSVSAAEFIDGGPILVAGIPENVSWLDDKTLVFVGAEPRGGFGFAPQYAHIYIWRMGSSPQVYRPDLWSPRGLSFPNTYLCAAEGEIHYSADAIAEPSKSEPRPATSVMAGPLGREVNKQEILRVADHVANFGLPLWSLAGNRCDRFTRRDGGRALRNDAWNISYRRDYALDFGSFVRGKFLYGAPRLFSWPSLKEIPLKQRPVDVRPPCTTSPPWERAFIAWACPGLSADMMDRTRYSIWKILMDGNVIRTDVFTGDLWGITLIPTRDGYFAEVAGSKHFMEPKDPDAGIYRIQNGKLKKLLDGAFAIQAVSPNGCLGAFATVELKRKMTVIDFCKLARE